MSLTGKLGTIDSQPGNIEFGLSVDLNQLVSQTIVFVQVAEGDSHREEVEQTLSFVQVAAGVVDRPVSASSTLAFTDLAEQGTTFPEDADNTLAFVGVATFIHEINVEVEQSLGLTQDLDVQGPIYRTVPQTIPFVQDADVQGPIYETLHQYLNLTDSGYNENLYVTATNVLNFTQSAGRVIEVSVSQSLAFTQTGERKNVIEHTLVFTQSAEAGKGGDVEQELDLEQVVTVEGIFVRSGIDTLDLIQSVTYYIDRSCTRFNYTPFVGTSDPDYTPPSTTEPTLGSARLRLTYPYTSPTLTLTLPNPAFSDKDRLNFNRINRETRGGTLVIFSDPKWPKTQTLALQVDNLNPNQAEDMITFLRTSLGKEIGLRDWEDRVWRGIITTPDARITHVGRHDRSIAFEFQGELA